MKALLLSKYRHLEIADLPNPVPGPGEILVKVAACGICGSDVHGYDGSSGRRIPPIVMGHEAAGRIAAVGSGVTGLTEGDRVTFDSTIYCGACGYCKLGEVNLCDHRQVLGVSCGDYSRAGAFAEFVAVPARVVYKLPESISFAEAALREAGCKRVLVSDVDETRLKMAKELGAAEVLLADADVVAQVLRRTGGVGVDVAIEAVGRNETVHAAIASVRKGGTVVLVGNISPEVTLPLQKVVTRQIRLQGSCASAGEYPEAIALMASGAIRVKPLITAIAPLAEGPAWFERLYAREPNLLKVVLTPGSIS